jgi:hypothetical protein
LTAWTTTRRRRDSNSSPRTTRPAIDGVDDNTTTTGRWVLCRIVLNSLFLCFFSDFQADSFDHQKNSEFLRFSLKHFCSSLFFCWSGGLVSLESRLSSGLFE